MRTFGSYPPLCFFQSISDCLAEHPERKTPEVLRDLSMLVDLYQRAKEPYANYWLELVACRLKRDFLRQDPCFDDEEIQFFEKEPIRLASFLNELLSPMIEFFGPVKEITFYPLLVDSVNQENTEALVGFIENLKTLKNLKKVNIKFRSGKEFIRAFKMGLADLSFVELTIEIESVQQKHHDSLAAVLAKGINIHSLYLPANFFLSSGRTLDNIIHFFSNLEFPKVRRF